jgi:hypothetical protein
MDKLGLLTVMPVALVLLVGWLRQPALDVFRVDARGLGHEHATLWRRQRRAIGAAIASLFDRLDGFRLQVALLMRHPVIRPMSIAAALLLAVFVAPACAAPFAMGTLTEGSTRVNS